MQTELDIQETKIENSSNLVRLESNDRLLIFYLLSILNVLINMDQGTLPAASNEIKSHLDVDNTTLGSFGSLVYIGNLIGSLFLIKLINVINRKYIVILSAVLNALCLLTFIEVHYLYILYINRVLTGLVRSYITIYFPVWIDQYGSKKWKTLTKKRFSKNLVSQIG